MGRVKPHHTEYSTDQLRAAVFLFGYYGGLTSSGATSPGIVEARERLRDIHHDFRTPFEEPIETTTAQYAQRLLGFDGPHHHDRTRELIAENERLTEERDDLLRRIERLKERA